MTQSQPKGVRLLLILVAITAALSLLYGIQYYLGGPLRLQVVSEIHSLDLASDASMVAAGASDGGVKVWDLPPEVRTEVDRDFEVAAEESWPVRTLEGLDGPVLDLGFTSDSEALIGVAGNSEIQTWDLASAAVIQEWEFGAGTLIDADLADDRQHLATLGQDGAIRIWDLAVAQEIQSIEAGDSPPGAIAINADGTLVAAGSETGAQIWDVGSGEAIATYEAYCEEESITTQEACDEADEDWLGHEKAVTALAFSPDDEFLATGSADTTIVFWELETGEAKYTSAGHWSEVTTLIFHQDGSAALSGSKDFKTRNLRMPGGKSTAIFEGHLSTVTGVAFGPQEDTIITVSEDGTLRVWGMANQYVVHLEWLRLGLQPLWGRVFAAWMLISGVLGLVSFIGLSRTRIWGHLLAMGLFLLGPVVVLGLPILEVLTYPLELQPKLQIAAPLLLLVVWYVFLYIVLTREPVALLFEAPRKAGLSEQLMVSRRTVKTRMGIYGAAVWIALLVILYSVLRRFNLDIAFMGSFLRFIMLGSGITFYVSALSIILAVFLALMGALGRLSKNPIANSVAGFYISLIRGTPLLVQIYIWYLGLPRLDIVLLPQVAGILALGVNYGAYMTEIFRAGIQAISIGQREAAQALGMSSMQTYRRIILPQAFRIVIPPIGNQFIAMMKDSSLVSVMAVQELTWRANKIGRQYFRGMETFIIAAAFYWVLTVVFQFFQGRLEEYMARGERR